MTDRADEIARERARALTERYWREIVSRDQSVEMLLAYRNAALGEAVEACREIENNDGDEHYEYCDCVTVVEDECNCYMSKFRKAVAALKEKP